MRGEQVVEYAPKTAACFLRCAVISDFDVDLLVAAAHLIVVVEARKRVSNFKDFIEFSVGKKLHNLVHLDLNAG